MDVHCVIVDDNSRFRRAAHKILESDGIVIDGVAATRKQALALVRALHPDLTLIDISLGLENGFDLVSDLAAAGLIGRTTIVMVSTYAKTDVIDVVEASPACAFLSKCELSGDALRDILTQHSDPTSAVG